MKTSTGLPWQKYGTQAGAATVSLDVLRYGVLARRAKGRPVLTESVIFALLCFADMISTIFLIEAGLAIEANPVLEPFVQQSWVSFVLVKSATFLIPVAALEVIRPLRPQFIRRALQCASVAYVSWYGILSLHVNGLLPF